MSIKLFHAYVDCVFKALFEKHPEALADLICAIKGWPEGSIKNLYYKNKELVRHHRQGKGGVVDILVELDDGTKVQVEIQVARDLFHIERSVFYLCRIFGMQLRKSKSYAELHNVISINIVLFNIFNDTRAFRKILLKDSETNEILTSMIEIHFVELNKNLMNNKCSERAAKWFHFMRDVNQVRKQLADDPIFKPLYKELEALSCDPEMIWAYESAIKRIYDKESSAKNAQILAERAASAARIAGIEEGRAEGKAEGKAEAKKEFIQNMLKNGLSVDQIAKMTNLPIAEIHKIAQQLN